ncbi:MAG TPA: hypothetical protein VGQ12_08060 [Candidatus Angelobacter sp.]|jgi:hypothetical protein|nr:hypothetical protein [Candidatus Angelobacter sp.]
MSTLPPAPRHPFELRISIGGDDWDYVVRVIRELAVHIEEHGPDCAMCSGGAGGCHSVDIQRREISVEAYRKELADWFNAIPKPKEPETNGQEPIATIQGEPHS